jgi:hypothetical protein
MTAKQSQKGSDTVALFKIAYKTENGHVNL